MNAWWIRHNAVDNRNRVDYVHDKTQPMAEAFFTTLVSSAKIPPPQQRTLILSILTGFVIHSVFIEGFGVTKPETKQFVERFDWFESTFAPLCDP